MTTAPASAPFISAHGVTKIYGEGAQRTVALKPVDFALQPGELVMLAGPSGSGKSTLLAILSGLLTPTSGRVAALGRDYQSFSSNELDEFRLAHFGFIFQGFHLLPALSALEQVSIVLQRQGVKRLDAEARARAALEEVAVGHRLDKRPAELSGGEKQRVVIARALAKRPQVIFADEPTSALDSENGAQIARLLKDATRLHGASVLCVTHDPRLESFADRLIHMEDGALKP